jgi:hypothetical protein
LGQRPVLLARVDERRRDYQTVGVEDNVANTAETPILRNGITVFDCDPVRLTDCFLDVLPCGLTVLREQEVYSQLRQWAQGEQPQKRWATWHRVDMRLNSLL